MSAPLQNPLLIVDLEATCWENRITPAGEAQSIHNMEIIEFGCVLANRSGEVLDQRSFLVRPETQPMLSDFCQSLTSITQAQVDAAPGYCEVVAEIDRWLGEAADSIWCSWGNYDRYHVIADSQKHGCQPAFLRLPHLNLKRIWRRTTGQKRKNGMAHALAYHGLELQGHHHRGIDDALNMARILPFMDWALEPELLTLPDDQTPCED